MKRRQLPTAPSDLPRPVATSITGAAELASVRARIEQQVSAIESSLTQLSSLAQGLGAAPAAETEQSSQKRLRSETSEAGTDAEWTEGCTDLVAIRQRLREFAVQRDWDQFHTPRNIALALVGEIGELAECFQWKGDAGCTAGLPDWEPKKKEALSEELADCLLYLIRLADKCGVDLPAATERKLAKNAAKYPASLVRGSAKKYNEYDPAMTSAAAAQDAAMKKD